MFQSLQIMELMKCPELCVILFNSVRLHYKNFNFFSGWTLLSSQRICLQKAGCHVSCKYSLHVQDFFLMNNLYSNYHHYNSTKAHEWYTRFVGETSAPSGMDSHGYPNFTPYDGHDTLSAGKSWFTPSFVFQLRD